MSDDQSSDPTMFVLESPVDLLSEAIKRREDTIRLLEVEHATHVRRAEVVRDRLTKLKSDHIAFISAKARIEGGNP